MTVADDPAGALVWDEERAQRWLANIDAAERQLEPIADVLFEHAALLPGERVLDVGCGSGVTTARAADLVAPEVGGHPAGLEETGQVVGTDISPAMIAAARERHSRPAIEWLVADAQTHDFGDSAFDVVISRFGVMFFADPGAAFANLATACRSRGRLAITVWQRRSAVSFFAVPLATALETLERLSVPHRPPPPEDAGPFSLAEAPFVRGLLERGGWIDVDFQSDDRQLYLGGPGSPSRAVEVAIRSRAVEHVLEDQPAEVVEEVRAALLVMAQERHDGAGVPLASGTWVVTATRA